MSVTLMLATALAFTPIEPEPVQFDTEAIEQAVRFEIEMEINAIGQEALKMELTGEEIVAQVESEDFEADAE